MTTTPSPADLTMTPDETVTYLTANPRFAATVRARARAVAERLKADEEHK